MKKSIITLSIVFASLAGFGQTQPHKQKLVTIQLTPEGIDLLLKGLAELPAKESYQLIQYLQIQAQNQLQEKQADTTVKQPVKKDQPKKDK